MLEFEQASSCSLENIGSQLGKLGPLAFLEFDVRSDSLRTEPAHQVIETVGRRIHIGVVDLVRSPVNTTLVP
jgi:hypothetical protein